MTLPSHILSAPTPRTDKLNIQWNAYINLGLNEKPLTFEDFCAQLERELLYASEVMDKMANELQELRQELHYAEQAASENGDWFDCLVNDLSKIVESDKRPSDVISKVQELQRKAKALDWFEQHWTEYAFTFGRDNEWMIFERKRGSVLGRGKSLLEAIEIAMKETK